MLVRLTKDVFINTKQICFVKRYSVIVDGNRRYFVTFYLVNGKQVTICGSKQYIDRVMCKLEELLN